MKNLYLYGEIYTGSVDENLVQGVISTLVEGEDLTVFINSPGGSVFTGLAIYNQLLAIKETHKVFVKIIGIAASMASVIACASDYVEIADNAFMLIHNPNNLAWGDENVMAKGLKEIKLIKASIVNAYMDKTGQAEQTIIDKMEEGTLMDAKECIAFKLADKITKFKVDETKAVYSEFYKYAASISNKHIKKPIADNNQKRIESNDLLIKDGGKMPLSEAEIVKLQMDYANSSKELEQARVNLREGRDHVKELTAKMDSLTKEKTDFEARVLSLESERKTLRHEKNSIEIKALVQKLKSEGKVKDDEIENAEKELLIFKESDLKFDEKTSMYEHEVAKLEIRKPSVNQEPLKIVNGLGESLNDDHAKVVDEAVVEFTKGRAV